MRLSAGFRSPFSLIFCTLLNVKWAGRASGLQVGQNFRPTTFADFSHGLLVNDTLRGAMDFNRKYQAVNQQYGRATLSVEGTSAYVEVQPVENDIDYMRPAMEAIFAGYVGIGKWLTWTTGEDLLSMRFRHSKPAHARSSREVFGCPVHYDEPVTGWRLMPHSSISLFRPAIRTSSKHSRSD